MIVAPKNSTSWNRCKAKGGPSWPSFFYNFKVSTKKSLRYCFECALGVRFSCPPNHTKVSSPPRNERMPMYRYCLYLLAISLILPVHAQERSASGGLKSQQSWTALSNAAKAASQRAEAVNARLDQVTVCSAKGKVYGPGAGNADSNGCVATSSDQWLANQILHCSQQGRVFNGGGCIYATAGSSAAAPTNCRMEIKSIGSCHNSASWCGTGWTLLDTGAGWCGSQQDTAYQTIRCTRVVCD